MFAEAMRSATLLTVAYVALLSAGCPKGGSGDPSCVPIAVTAEDAGPAVCRDCGDSLCCVQQQLCCGGQCCVKGTHKGDQACCTVSDPTGSDISLRCTDIEDDADNCGACGKHCDVGSHCTAGCCVTDVPGECVPYVPPPFVDSGPPDPAAQACGPASCDQYATCCGGQCCEPRMTGDSTVLTGICCTFENHPDEPLCVDPSTDSFNCGGCGIVCPGTCTKGCCDPVSPDAGSCVPTNLDPDAGPPECHTPTCGFDGQYQCCSQYELCCTIACCSSTDSHTGLYDPRTGCCGVYGDGRLHLTCVSLSSDPLNCGSCGVVCPSGECVGGCCTPQSEAG